MNAAQHILSFGIKAYRLFLSPARVFVFGALGRCRFEPSCSAYALEAIRLHGAISGSMLAGRRICRCHPWGGCGWDPVPEPSTLDKVATHDQGTAASRVRGGAF